MSKKFVRDCFSRVWSTLESPRVQFAVGILAVVLSAAFVTVRFGTVLQKTVGVWLPHVLTVLGFLAAAAVAIMTVLGARHTHLSGLIRAHVDRLRKEKTDHEPGLRKNLEVQIKQFRVRNIQIRTSMKFACMAFVLAVLAAIFVVVFFITEVTVDAKAATDPQPQAASDKASVAQDSSRELPPPGKPEISLISSIIVFSLISTVGVAMLGLLLSLYHAYREFSDSPKTLDLEIYSVRGRLLDMSSIFSKAEEDEIKCSLIYNYDVRVVAVSDESVIPTGHKSEIVVAIVDDVYHFRVFDGVGKVVVDTNEKRLIDEVRKQLEQLKPPHELTDSEKGRVIATITSIKDLLPPEILTPAGTDPAPV